MKSSPVFPPKVFHRIQFSSDSSVQERETRRLGEMIKKGSASMVSTEFSKEFRAGHGLVVASWDRWDESARAKVHALGVVIKNAPGEPEVRWVPVQCELPTSSRDGGEHWIKPAFRFAPSVAKDFKLEKLFEERRTELLTGIP